MAGFFAAVRGVAKHPEQFKAMINCCEKLQEAFGVMCDEEARAKFMQSERWPDKSSGAGMPATGPDLQAKVCLFQEAQTIDIRKAAKAYSNLVAINPF
jgi:hypothetical protein